MIFVNGSDSIFYIKHDGVFVPISCEISNTFSESSQMISTTTRDNKGWETSRPTMQSYTIALEAQAVIEDSNNLLSYWELTRKKRSREVLEWKIETLNGAYIDEGFATITDISNVAQANEFMTFSLNLQGYGRAE